MNKISDISILFVFYAMLLLLIFVINRKRPGIASYQNPRSSDLHILSAVHLAGTFFMLLSTWLINSSPFFILLLPDKLSYIQIFGLTTCIFVIVYLPWKKWNNGLQHLVDYPLSSAQITFYFASRIIFLIVYEWFFRGLLLMNLFYLLGTAWAVSINILLYMLAHFHKSRKEIIGCIPFGLLLCLFTIWWQSIWPAVIIHLFMAIINEWPPVCRFFLLQKKAAL